MRRLKKIAWVSVVVLYFPLIFSFISIGKDKVVCGVISSSICDSVENRFITPGEIRTLVLEKYPGILGRKVKEINTEEMEVFFEKHPAVNNCEVYFTYGGSLHVDVTQREPLVRVFDANESFYLDMNGQKMPVFRNYSAHILVAAGYIGRLKETDGLMRISKMIYEDQFWKAQIEQVYVNEQGELILVPRVGDHLIEFGGLERMEEKFRNLRALYNQGWDAREWNLYKKVNLKYKGQVVCTKG
ncbi:MAG: cell division protein FtsQ [Marinilabiliaceae bacterium]|nr:cell division protein FtsQ [Marinilabiliaceae bacterium]